MARSHGTELAAAATAALERLDRYTQGLDELLRSPHDTSLYARNSEHFEAVRALTATLPHVRICWVDVLISRLELLDAVCRANRDDDRGLARLQERHLESLECFRRHCWDCISSNLELRSQPALERREAGSETVLQAVQRRVQEAALHVEQQRERIARLEAVGADASSAYKVLRTLQDALDGMRRTLEVARRMNG